MNALKIVFADKKVQEALTHGVLSALQIYSESCLDNKSIIQLLCAPQDL